MEKLKMINHKKYYKKHKCQFCLRRKTIFYTYVAGRAESWGYFLCEKHRRSEGF